MRRLLTGLSVVALSRELDRPGATEPQCAQRTFQVRARQRGYQAVSYWQLNDRYRRTRSGGYRAVAVTTGSRARLAGWRRTRGRGGACRWHGGGHLAGTCRS
jgi:hypothetical protein